MDKENRNYKIVYRDKSIANMPIAVYNIVVPLPNIRYCAKYMNNFIRKNPDKEILTAYIVDDNGDFLHATKFLFHEYKNQHWLTGYKERLLLHAYYKNMDIKWKPCWV